MIVKVAAVDILIPATLARMKPFLACFKYFTLGEIALRYSSSGSFLFGSTVLCSVGWYRGVNENGYNCFQYSGFEPSSTRMMLKELTQSF